MARNALTSLRWWGRFALAGAYFLLFGVCSFNLFAILSANIHLFIDHGIMVIADGALEQFIQLVALGYLSLFLWICFKRSETLLVADLTRAQSEKQPVDADDAK